MHPGKMFHLELHLHYISASFKKVLPSKYTEKCVLTLNNDVRVSATILNWQCRKHSM